MKKSKPLSLIAAAVLLAVAAVAQQQPLEAPASTAAAPENAPDHTQAAVPADPPDAAPDQQAEEPAEPAPVEEGWARYAILYQRNIFSRSRTRPRPAENRRDRTEEEAPPPPSPESYHVLKGVVRQNGRYIAFVEDTRDGYLSRFRIGDALARGTVDALTLDRLDYKRDDIVIRIEIGSNLEGEYTAPAITADQLIRWSQSAAAAEPASPSADDAAPATESTTQPEPADDEAELLRQLMERRQQELGQ